jgi:hypothetical protein
LKELRDREQRTGGGGSERQRAKERDPSLPAVEEVRDREQRRENRAPEVEEVRDREQRREIRAYRR